MDDTVSAPAVLLVDDNAAQRTALRAVLGDLTVSVVEAESGRDALRCMLRQPFAVILLDVNMPGLDGFETAELIRQRPSSEHTPIIFVTAHGDDAAISRSYALGAVDFILTPVQPDVLRAKVAVFIDLYRNAEEIRRQREGLQRYATQLRQLSEASLAIYSARAFDDLLHVVAESAQRIIGTRQVSVSVAAQAPGIITTVSCGIAADGEPINRLFRGPGGDALQLERPVRLPRPQNGAPLSGEIVPAELIKGLPLDGWLAAPVVTREGRVVGLIQLSDKIDGEFTAEDEGLAMQLARLASTTIDSAVAAEAREANRMKDEFLGVLSHELRTPLQAIFSWVDILRQREHDPALLAQAADVVERSAQTQMRLIGDLLDVSRISRGHLGLERAAVNFTAVIEQSIETVRPTAELKHTTLHFDAPAQPYTVIGDATRLQQVVWNLLSNAVKFTNEGGRVEISLRPLGGDLSLQVHDDGPGIPPAFLPHVFERFRQADSSAARPHGGLGLGLAIVRHLVELHGGRVLAANAAGG